MDRLEGTGFDAPLHRKTLPASRVAEKTSPARRRSWLWGMAALIVLGVAAAVYFGAAPALSWLLNVPPAARLTTQIAAEPLPIVRTADTLLDRARELNAGGHLHDALRLLDRIGIADPVRSDADRLRADIQRELLAAASAGTPTPNDTGTRQ